jgi:hypothetical protein
MTVYSNVCYVGEDFKSDLRYSPRVVAAIGAAIEEDVFGFIAKKGSYRAAPIQQGAPWLVGYNQGDY